MQLHPELFQECSESFVVIFTCEESIYDKVVEDLCASGQATSPPVHVVKVDTEGAVGDATLGGCPTCELCQCPQLVEDMEDTVWVSCSWLYRRNKKELSSHGLFLLKILVGLDSFIRKNLYVDFLTLLYFL